MRLAAPDRRKQLIETATELFSEQGFHGTSTREIAEAAGVNESLIFRYFPTKEELFGAVLADKLQSIGAQWDVSRHFDSNRSEADVFVAMAAELLNRTADDAALTRLLLYAALRGDLSDQLFRTCLAAPYEVLTQYIRQGVARGRFRELDPKVAARAFLGMIVYHQVVQELLGGARDQKFTPQRLGTELVEILLHGISEPGRKQHDNGNRRRSPAERVAAAERANGKLE